MAFCTCHSYPKRLNPLHLYIQEGQIPKPQALRAYASVRLRTAIYQETNERLGMEAISLRTLFINKQRIKRTTGFKPCFTN